MKDKVEPLPEAKLGDRPYPYWGFDGFTVSRRSFLGWMMGIAGGTIAGCSTPDPSQSVANSTGGKTMKLESPVFQANGPIPAKYTCDGANISPPLLWSAPPTNTQSLALIVDDPDAPSKTFVHWVVYNLPSNLHELPEQVAAQSTISGGTQGRNDFGQLGYGGPCPPSGTHRYFFKLYALDRSLDLPQGATKAQLLQAMESHVLTTAELIGLYKRQG